MYICQLIRSTVVRNWLLLPKMYGVVAEPWVCISSLSSGKWFLCIGAVLLMFALSDLFAPGMQPAQADQGTSATQKQPKFASKAFVGPTIKFLYW